VFLPTDLKQILRAFGAQDDTLAGCVKGEGRKRRKPPLLFFFQSRAHACHPERARGRRASEGSVWQPSRLAAPRSPLPAPFRAPFRPCL